MSNFFPFILLCTVTVVQYTPFTILYNVHTLLALVPLPTVCTLPPPPPTLVEGGCGGGESCLAWITICLIIIPACTSCTYKMNSRHFSAMFFPPRGSQLQGFHFLVGTFMLFLKEFHDDIKKTYFSWWFVSYLYIPYSLPTMGDIFPQIDYALYTKTTLAFICLNTYVYRESYYLT